MGHHATLDEAAAEIAGRLTRIFLRDSSGRRPVLGGPGLFQSDPHWRDHILFYEYFHGDNGAGLGASHQTGWTALVAELIDWNHALVGHTPGCDRTRHRILATSGQLELPGLRPASIR